MADVVIVQRTVRQRLASKQVAVLRQERDFTIENRAATDIQKIWRGYHAHMGMLFTLVHIIVAQSVARRFLALVRFRPMMTKYRAAILIQKTFRGYVVKRDYDEYMGACKIQALVRTMIARNVYIDYQAARTIQAQTRTMIAMKDLHYYQAARDIQTWYRCYSVNRDYLVFISARKIQSQWRGFEARRAVADELWLRDDAAISIQKQWRMFYQCSNFTIMSFERHAASIIQKHWRGFWQFSHYVILRFEIVRIQAFARGCAQRRKLELAHDCATIMQSTARCFLAKKNCHMERLIMAMVKSASLSLSTRLASTRIQRWYRATNSRGEERKAALVIERFFIWVRREVEEEIDRREKMKLVKRKKQRRRRMDEEDTLLESVWNGTVCGESISGQKKEKGRKSKSKGHRKKKSDKISKGEESDSKTKEGKKKSTAKQGKSAGHPKEYRQEGPQKDKSSNPTRFSFYDPDEQFPIMELPTATVNMEKDYPDTHSDVSGITTPSVFVSPLSRLKVKNQDSADVDLEDAWMSASVKRTSTANRGKKGKKEKTNRMQRKNSKDSFKENDDAHVTLVKNSAAPMEPRRQHRDLLRRGR
eukprot:CAMPEP_0198258590 /NCGR_PEP_ID=MMETSP1447-20131203/7968_1 /TAXON_ID=420782 /ORGANISM="Chaetoceros dichaeta, Strain CCMP1751" /LENGTH=589 /DNA_ID=CAMNT_0043945743 /DNA_START=277 /DNA_END=2046 /DNA_ORIENTATION=+